MILAMENDINSDDEASVTSCGMCGQQPDVLLQLASLGAVCVPCLVEAHDAAQALIAANQFIGSISRLGNTTPFLQHPALKLVK